MASVKQVLLEIRRLGNEGTLEIYRRHGVTQPTVGSSYAELGKLERGTRPRARSGAASS